MISSRILLVLVVVAVVLPIAICVVGGTGELLSMLGDRTGAMVLEYGALGLGLIWIIDLILLAIVQGINGLSGPPDAPEE
ncbi:MAG TPA: hypothetical protein VFE24_12920 [Pirellulales bacterium]|nr:hypothetical protein [Pirellulales bacterium]